MYGDTPKNVDNTHLRAKLGAATKADSGRPANRDAGFRRESRRPHPGHQAVQVRSRSQLNADQRLTGFPVVALDVLEQGDVVVGPEHLVEEAAQRAGLLREVHQEVVLEAQVDQRALQHLAVARNVVVAARDQANHGGPGFDIGFQQAGHRERARRLGDDALVLIEVEHRGAHRTLVDGGDRHHVAGGGQRRIGQGAGPAHRGAVDELVDVVQRHRLPRRQRRHHGGGSGRLDAQHRGVAWSARRGRS